MSFYLGVQLMGQTGQSAMAVLIQLLLACCVSSRTQCGTGTGLKQLSGEVRKNSFVVSTGQKTSTIQRIGSRSHCMTQCSLPAFHIQPYLLPVLMLLLLFIFTTSCHSNISGNHSLAHSIRPCFLQDIQQQTGL